MAWKVTLKNGYTVMSETIRSVSGRAVNTSEFTVPPGCDFQIIANYAGTNLSASTHVELLASDVSGGTFYRRNHTPFISLTSEIDNATKVLSYDNSLRGQFPVYKFKVPTGGGLVKFVVIVGNPDA